MNLSWSKDFLSLIILNFDYHYSWGSTNPTTDGSIIWPSEDSRFGKLDNKSHRWCQSPTSGTSRADSPGSHTSAGISSKTDQCINASLSSTKRLTSHGISFCCLVIRREYWNSEFPRIRAVLFHNPLWNLPDLLQSDLKIRHHVPLPLRSSW